MPSAPWEPDPEAVQAGHGKKLHQKAKKKKRKVSPEEGATEVRPYDTSDSIDDPNADLVPASELSKPKDCICSKERGCQSKDKCCGSGASKCPCQDLPRQPELPEYAACTQCMEDGVRRNCCKKHYCRYCYEHTGNCPGCGLITVGNNKGKYWADLEGGAKGELVRDGEECRLCLKQAFRRKCCGEFYCSTCYFKDGSCPSCGQSAERRVQYKRIPRDPGFLPVLLGWVITIIICLTALALATVMYTNNKLLPVTVFGHRCYGFFPSCSYDLGCVAFQGTMTSGLPEPITGWTSCSLATVNKVYGSYCLYDKQVYVYSDEKWGFDFCEDSFVGGVYVFQDNIEHWANSSYTSNRMASARWANVTNGVPDTKCGVAGGKEALYFSGANYRSAETLDVDVRYGGYIKFYLKMGPYKESLDRDDPRVTCKPTYAGNVFLYYSTDRGVTWSLLKMLETAGYRNEHFTLAKVDILGAAISQSTRFLFKQENFENAYEHWALDDVEVVSNFRPDWSTSAEFSSEKDKQEEILMEIRCCLNSEQCALSKRKQEKLDCKQYSSHEGNKRAVMGAEMFVILAGAITLLKFFYSIGQGITVEGAEFVIPPPLRKKKAKLFLADDAPAGTMDGQFPLKIQKRWRLTFLALTCGPYAVCWLWCAALLRNFYLAEDITLLKNIHPVVWHFQVHIAGVFLLASYLDLSVIGLVAQKVVCVLPIWVPKVDIDLRPNASWLQLGNRVIPLKMIKDAEMFSKGECQWVAAGYVIGCLPWCLLSLIVKYYYLPYNVSRYTSNILGVLLLLRHWMGKDWVIKSAHCLYWMVSTNMYHRDEIGGAVTAHKTKWLMWYSMVVAGVMGCILSALVDTSILGIVAGVSAGGALIYGLLLAVVQGLPVTPSFKITSIEKGLFIRFYREVLCPCELRFQHCGDMHSRDEVLCIFVRDSLTFQELLRGDDTIEA